MTTTDSGRIEAERLLRAGRTDDAIAAYSDLVKLDARPDDWFNLGWLQRNVRNFDEALISYAAALSRGIAHPEEVHLNRAAIFSEELGNIAAAETELRQAVELDPRFTAAWLNLGNLYEDIGSTDEARAAYETALNTSPGHGRALARLTAIELFAGTAGGRIDMLLAALRRPSLDPDQAAEILFALGAALDAEGRYDEAFAAVTRANRTVRVRLGQNGGYDQATHERTVDALIAAPQLPEAVGAATGATPIFLCGMFRSGSTLAEQLLARHSQITAGGELDIIPRLMAEQLDGDPARLSDLTAHDIVELRRIYVDRVGKLHPGATIVTDKRSDNFLHIGLIKAMFPSARIVHTVREPIDNILSVFFLYFADSVRYGWAIEDIVHWFGQYRRMMAHWQSRFPGDIHDLSYDALVTAPEAELADALAFCGLPNEPVLEIPPDKVAIRTASAWQVRKPLHMRSSGRWKNYPKPAAYVRNLLGDD